MTQQQRRRMWVDRLERFSQANQTVASFCQSEGVSTPSFYSWKRRLANENDLPTKRPLPRPRFTELALTGTSTIRATATLSNGIRIELGDNETIVSAIVEQLLTHQALQPLQQQTVQRQEPRKC